MEQRVRELEERLRRIEGSQAIAPPATPSVVRPAEGPAPGGEQTPNPSPGGGAGPGAAGGAPGEPKLSPEERVSELENRLRGTVGTVLDKVRLALVLDPAFTWNFNDPRNRRVDVNRLRVNDPDHDTFYIAWSKLSVGRPTTTENDWDAGVLWELAVGREVQNTLSLDTRFLRDSPINIAQAYVDLQAPLPHGHSGLIRFGRQYGWLGVESLDTPANPNFSLGFLTRNSPFTNTGAGVGTDLGLGFRYAQYVVNGWDVVIDNNDAKSLGGQLHWETKNATDFSEAFIAFNWIWGCEREENNHDRRLLLDLAGLWKPIDGTQFRVDLQWGYEEGANVNTGGIAKFGGVLVIFRQEFYEVRERFRRFAFAIRGEYYRDQGGALTGVNQALGEVTGTFEIRFMDFARLRFEYRHDWSTAEGGFFFGRNRRPNRSEQDTVSIDAAFQF